MIPPRRSDRDDYQELRDLEKSQTPEPEPTRPEGHPGARTPGGPRTGRMEDHFSWALEEAKRRNERIQERRPDQQNVPEGDEQKAQPEHQAPRPPQQEQPEEKPELSLPPEKNQADWRRMISDPDYRREVEQQEREVKEPQRQRTQETPQQARPVGDQPEKKAEEKEVDWRRTLTDPDYRQQVSEREREVKEPQRQQTQETPQQARPVWDQPEKKAEGKEVDWRRTLTDPDYRQQVREQERAENMERAGEHLQEAGAGPQRPPSGRER